MYSYGKNVFFNQGSILIDEIFLSHMPFDINMKDAQLTKTNEKSNFFPTKDMQTPPRILKCGHLYIKDGECFESNEKSYFS